ncbi:aminopeptidase P family protein [Methyloligella sp. 2.7D]|uniref:aminopeptidase P family protein n=1 Tax=unclassified Methyloligella TaxID=2625955 RepID=UPI00157BC823|nr:aminopeptidase P family protein [Methyloligella sp. GL2]QKP77980.1 aminopeptidase P family protein [Methyloligella sp. GL2]
MFQTYDETPPSGSAADRLGALRDALDTHGIQGFLVPHSDEHQNEFLPASAERLHWLTGFSGSAGTAIVTLDDAVLFVDGRYRLQARQQVDTGLYEILQIPGHRPSHWIAEKLSAGDKLGYDANLHTVKEIERLTETLGESGISLVPLADNPIDSLWTGRPPAPSAPAYPHGERFSGKSAQEKIAHVREQLDHAGADALLLTMLDSIAWLFNIRGGDISHTPLVLSFALVPAEGRPTLFVDPAKIGDNVRGALGELIDFQPPKALDDALAALGAEKAVVKLDPTTTPARFENVLRDAGASILHRTDPCIAAKAIKTEAEIEGARAAHLRDGIAMARFLAWLDREGQDGGVDEVDAAVKLESFRADTGELKEISFDSISAAGPNGAVVHYRPMNATKRKLEPGSLYLIDSGAQYEDGTTDITRTVAIGAPTPEMRRHYTLVLKGHIAVSRARFPEKTRGQDLDPLARLPLWQAGLDYDHGTGHGVGSFLSVHEGPQRLSRAGTVELKPGMILSNEPGYYREGEYGIRIENLVLVTPPAPIEGGEREMLGFETLTLAPYDNRLIEIALLTSEEITWLNDYNTRVRDALIPGLRGADIDWLRQATAPFA